MTKVSEMLGIDQKLEKMVAEALQKKSLTLLDIKAIIKQHTESLSADVYSNMKEIAHCKYRMVEIETKLSTLSDICKTLK